jgi:hypothetical protein
MISMETELLRIDLWSSINHNRMPRVILERSRSTRTLSEVVEWERSFRIERFKTEALIGRDPHLITSSKVEYLLSRDLDAITESKQGG